MDQLYPEFQSGLDPLSIYDDVTFPDGDGTLPYVALNMVSSIDGKITFNRNKNRAPIGSPVDRTLMGRLRVGFDAILRGAETVRANPFLPSVPEEGEAKRMEQGLPAQPMTVVFSRSLDLPLMSAFFHQRDRVIVVTAGATDEDKVEKVRQRVPVEVVGDEDVDVVEALTLLRSKYNLNRMLAEGGGGFNYHLFANGLVHELFWTLAPRMSGLEDDLTMVYGPEMLTPAPGFELRSLHVHDNELFMRWQVANNGPASR